MKMVLRWTTVHKAGPIHIGSLSLEIHCVNLVQASSHMSVFPMHYELLNFYPTIILPFTLDNTYNYNCLLYCLCFLLSRLVIFHGC